MRLITAYTFPSAAEARRNCINCIKKINTVRADCQEENEFFSESQGKISALTLYNRETP